MTLLYYKRKSGQKSEREEFLITIRSANDDDIESILDIYSPHASNPKSAITFEETVPSLEEMKRRRQQVIAANDPYLVAIRNNTVIGYAYTHPFRERPAYRFTTELSIYVKSGEQSRGAGRKLMKKLIHACRCNGKKSMIAVLGSESLQTWYKKFGFSTIGCFRNVGWKPQIGWIDRWMMELVFSSTWRYLHAHT